MGAAIRKSINSESSDNSSEEEYNGQGYMSGHPEGGRFGGFYGSYGSFPYSTSGMRHENYIGWDTQ